MTSPLASLKGGREGRAILTEAKRLQRELVRYKFNVLQCYHLVFFLHYSTSRKIASFVLNSR